MKKFIIALLLLITPSAFAQLPANPWDVSTLPAPNDGNFGDNLQQQALPNVPNAPAYSNGITNGQVLPVDPWANARDRSGIQTWRGSAQHGKLNYVGEATTYGTATGQEMIAPEVNRHNMGVMLDHFRSLGYEIPENYNTGLADMPSRYGRQLEHEYNEMMNANIDSNPIGGIARAFVEMFDNYTGLNTENLMFNSIKLLNTD